MSIFRKKKDNIKLTTFDGDVLLDERKDRRILPDVPDPSRQRSAFDRRGAQEAEQDIEAVMKKRKSGIRYQSSFPVNIIYEDEQKKKHTIVSESSDISETGILVQLNDQSNWEEIKNGKNLRLRFTIPPGSMPEGHEMKIRTAASFIREFERDGHTFIGLEFAEDLGTYTKRHKDRYLYVCSILLLFMISFMVVLMRGESIIYYKYNFVLYTYSIIAALFLLSRYAFGALYKPVKINPDFKPSVTIIIPCFNEET